MADIELVGLSTFDDGLPPAFTGDTLILDCSALSLQTDDVLVMEGWSYYNGGSGNGLAMGPDGAEGWVSAGSSSADTGRKVLQAWVKRWGEAGQTDDTTPELFVSAPVNGVAQGRISVWRGVNPNVDIADIAEAVASATGTSTTMTAPAVTTLGIGRRVLRLYGSVDDNTHGSPSGGDSLGYSHDSFSGSAMSMSHAAQASEGSSGTRTMSQTFNGADLWCALTIALPPLPPIEVTVTESFGLDAVALPVLAITSTRFESSTPSASQSTVATRTGSRNEGFAAMASNAASLDRFGNASATMDGDEQSAVAIDVDASAVEDGEAGAAQTAGLTSVGVRSESTDAGAVHQLLVVLAAARAESSSGAEASLAMTEFGTTVSETAEAAADHSAALITEVEQSEAAEASEASQGLLDLDAAMSEALAAAEVAEGGTLIAEQTTESSGLNEQQSERLEVSVSSLADVEGSDVSAMTLVRQAARSESLEGEDPSAAGLELVATDAELSTAGEGASAAMIHNAPASESATVATSEQGTFEAGAARTEESAHVDVSSMMVTLELAGEEAAEVHDVATGVTVIESSLTEALAADEASVSGGVFVAAAAEGLEGDETSTTILVFVASASEVAELHDDASGLIELGATVAEFSTLQDLATHIFVQGDHAPGRRIIVRAVKRSVDVKPQSRTVIVKRGK